MASFPTKIVWTRPRKRGNKNYRFVPFLSDALWKIPKKQQKNSKNKNKYHIVPFRSYPTRNRKFQKNSKKIQKKKKKPLWLHFKPKSVDRGREREKIKIIVSFRPYLTHN